MFEGIKNKIGLTASFLKRKKKKNFSLINFVKFVFKTFRKSESK